MSPGGLLLPRGIPEALALAHLVPRLVGAPTRGAVVQGEAAQPVLLLLSCIIIQWNSFVLSSSKFKSVVRPQWFRY